MTLQSSQNRIFGLDLLRAFAIILVVLEHGKIFLVKTSLENFPDFNMIDGVDMFFVLSGFLIGGILLREIDKSHSFSGKQLLRFWKRRWMRTLPNYYLILLLNYLVVKYGFIKEDITHFDFNFLIFTQNFKTPFYSFFWESWSLSIEEWFYIIAPILIFVLSRIFSLKKTFFITTVLMIIAPLLYRYSIYTETIDGLWWDLIFRKTVLTRLDSIGYGLLGAWLFFYYARLWSKYRYIYLGLGITLMIFIINYVAPVTTHYMQVYYFTLLPLSVLLTLPSFHHLKYAKGIIAFTIEKISKISYSMYLINLALVAEIIRDNFPPQNNPDAYLKYALYWFFVLGGSTLLYKYFEKPIMDMRR